MKKIVVTMLVIILLLSGCTNDNSNDSKHQDQTDETEFLSQYLELKNAEALLSETWVQILDYTNSNIGENIDLEAFQQSLVNCTDNYSSELFGILTHADNEGETVLSNNIMLPSIMDEETSITTVVLIPNENLRSGFELVITEEGQYRDLGYGHKRSNHFLVDENGEIKLYTISGSLGKFDYVREPEPITFFEDDVLEIVAGIENELSRLYEFETTIDDFDAYLSKVVTAGTSKKMTQSLLYTPHSIRGMFFPEATKKHLSPILMRNTKGQTLDAIKDNYYEQREAYIEYYYGQYTVDPVLYSQVLDEGYLKYVVTKKRVHVDFYGPDDITFFDVYNRYTIIYSDEKIVVTDVAKFEHFDHTKSWMKEDLELYRPTIFEFIEKFTTFEGIEIEFLDIDI